MCYSFILDTYFGYFYLLAIVNNAIMNTDVQISLQDPDFSDLGHMHRVRLLDHTVNSMFNFSEQQL